MSRITRLLTDSARIQRRGGPTRGRLAAGTAVLALGFSMTLAWARPADPPRSKIVASAQMEMLETLSDALKRSVAAGTISEKDAMAMYKMFAEEFAADLHKDQKPDDIAGVAKRKPVERCKIVAREISPEDVKWYFEGLRAALKQSVATGAISEKDAMATYTLLLTAVAEDMLKDEKAVDDAAIAKRKPVEGRKLVAGEISLEDTKRQFEALQIALKQSVATGAISENDAMAMYTLFLTAVADDMPKDQEAHEAAAID